MLSCVRQRKQIILLGGKGNVGLVLPLKRRLISAIEKEKSHSSIGEASHPVPVSLDQGRLVS